MGGPDFDFEAAWRAVEPEDVLCLIYTSGTTGPPKGVQLTHANMVAVWRACDAVRGDRARRPQHLLPAQRPHRRPLGHPLRADDLRHLRALLPGPAPDGRLLDRGQADRLGRGAADLGETEGGAGDGDGGRAGRRETRGGRVGDGDRPALGRRLHGGRRPRLDPDELQAEWDEADEQVFSKIRALLGLDEVESFVVGAAPTPPEVLEFFLAIGIEICETWGMSETSAMATLNPPGRVRVGTVGPPIPDTEVKLAEDGEVMVRGPQVMKGYRNMPEKTAEALTEDGWLLTGDIGEFDEAGYLRIVDRKKELIINAAGKNMSPANIEAKLKAASPLIAQAVAIGDRRPYNVALIALDPETPRRARRRGRGRGDRRGDRRRGRGRQRAPLAGRADQALHGDPRRVGARRRGADPDPEAQTPPDRAQVRSRDRGAVRLDCVQRPLGVSRRSQEPIAMLALGPERVRDGRSPDSRGDRGLGRGRRLGRAALAAGGGAGGAAGAGPDALRAAAAGDLLQPRRGRHRPRATGSAWCSASSPSLARRPARLVGREPGAAAARGRRPAPSSAPCSASTPATSATR